MLDSGSSDPSIFLWLGAAVVTVLGARVFIEYLRRVNYEGALPIWKEWLTGATALMLGIWAAMIVGVTAQNITFAIGYHPVRLFGGLIFAWLLAVVVMYWVSLKPGLWGLVSACALAAITTLLLEISVVWSIGAEPGLRWRPEPLLFALLVVAVGYGLSGWMVLTARRGSPQDRRGRRTLAGLVLGATILGASELVLTSAGLAKQSVSAYSRMLPDLAMSLFVGTGVPVILGLMFLDQYLKQQARAQERRRRVRRKVKDTNESMFMTESTFGALSELPPDAASEKP